MVKTKYNINNIRDIKSYSKKVLAYTINQCFNQNVYMSSLTYVTI